MPASGSQGSGEAELPFIITLGASIRECFHQVHTDLETMLTNAIQHPSDYSIPKAISEKIPLLAIDETASEEDLRELTKPQCGLSLWKLVRDLLTDMGEDSYMGECPTWFAPTMAWVARAYMDLVAISIKADYDIVLNLDEVPRRANIKSEIQAAKKEAVSTWVPTSSSLFGRGLPPPAATQPAHVAISPLTPSESDSEDGSGWSKRVRDVHLLVGANPPAEMMFSGNVPAGGYVRWRTLVLDKVLDHPVESVRLAAVLHCISEPKKSKVKRLIRSSGITTTTELFQRLDKDHLTVSEEAALVNEWVDVCQQPGETAYAYITRFEELIHLRSTTHPEQGSLHDKVLLSMLRRGFTDPLCCIALPLVDPTGEMGYEVYKEKLLAFLSSFSGSRAASTVGSLLPSVLSSLPQQATPGPKREDKTSKLKPKLADDSPLYAHVRSAITRQLGITDQSCLRCGKEGHYARNCSSTSIFRSSERCKICGGLSMVGGKPHQCKVSKRRVVCGSCGLSGHMSSICPTGKATSTSSPPAVSNQTVAQQLSYEFPIITAPASRTARVDVKARHGVLLDLPKLPEVSLRLGHDHSKGFCDVRALVDSGANASLMRDHLVSYFVEAGIIKTTDVVPLESPVHVGGISDSVLATHTATVCAASGGLEDVSLTFLMCRGIDNTIILGANMYPRLGIGLVATNEHVVTHNLKSTGDGGDSATVARAHAEAKLEPLITVEDFGDSKRLTAHIDVFSKTAMMPFRAPPRRRSETDERIIHHRLVSMAREKKVAQCNETDLIMICPVVIVDKQGPNTLRLYPDEKVDERYRITLDLRGVNSLSLAYDSTGAFILLPSKNASAVNTIAAFDTKSYRQSEVTALKRLRSIPAEYNTYYKLDLRDAYSSVAIDGSLQRCFGVLSYDVNNEPCYWRYCVLPQGWQWSSLLFGSAMEFMVIIIRDRLREHGIPAVIIHCKDDVVIAACCPNHAAIALSCAKDCFAEFSFCVNDQKTYGPADRICFFGFDLKRNCVAPTLKKEFTTTTVDLALTEWRLESGSDSRQRRLTWLRHWCGIFQCFKAHMDHQCMDALHHLQQALSFYQKTDEQVDNSVQNGDFSASVEIAFGKLCTMYLENGVTPLFTGLLRFEDTLGTVILTDANLRSFAGIILRAVRSTPATEALSSSTKVPVEFPAASDLFSIGSDVPYVLLPVKFVGGSFTHTDQRKSSTFRERYAVLDTVWQGRDMLAGEVVCIVDNANTMKAWADAHDTLHGVLLTKFENVMRCVHKFVWMRRHSAPKWADQLARSLDVVCKAAGVDEVDDGSVPADPLRFCTSFSTLQRAFTAWKSSTAFSETAVIPIDPDEARQWLLKAQESDDNCKLFRDLVAKGKTKFSIDDYGVLRLGDKYVIPSRYGKSLVTRLHCFYGHPGVRQTLQSASKDFYIYGIGNIVQKVVSSCYCQYVRAKRGPIKPPVSSLRSTIQVNDRWFLDTVGPLPASSVHNFRHVLSIQDAASSLVFFLPLCATTTAAIIAAIEEKLFSFIQPPRCFTVDNAASFQAVAFKGWAASWGVRVFFNPPYSAHRNGSLERQHGVLKQVLKCLCRGNIDEWPSFLPVAQRRCNSRTIYGDYTPYQLYFGMEDSSFFARRFEDIAPSLDADTVKFEAKRRAARREANLRHVHEALDAAEADTLLKLSTARRIVSRRRVFQVGQKVLKWTGSTTSLGVNWSGPHVITECCGPNQMTYRLSDGSTQDSHNLCLYH